MRFLTPFVFLVMLGLAVSACCQTIPPPVPVPVLRLAPTPPLGAILIAPVRPNVADSCVRGGLVEVIAPEIVQQSVEGIRIVPLTVLRRVAELTAPSNHPPFASPADGLSLPQHKTWGDRLNEEVGKRLQELPSPQTAPHAPAARPDRIGPWPQWTPRQPLPLYWEGKR